MFSFLSALVPKRGSAAAHSPDEPFDEDPASVFVPPAPLINETVVESAEPATVPADSPADEVVAEAHVAEAHVAEAHVAETPAVEMPVANVPVANVPVADVPVADVPVVDVPVIDVRSVEEELREERLLIERQLAERLEEQRLAEEARAAEEAAAEERRVAEQRERWRAEQAAEAKRLRAEREEIEQQEADRIVAQREETERRAAPDEESARFSWPATLLHHAAPMDYGAGVRRHLLSTIVELRDPNLVAVLYDALYEESSDGLRPDVLDALRAAYHGEALRETYERFARIGNDREREIAREGLVTLAARAS